MFSSFIGTINYHSPIPWAWLEYLSSSSWISVLCGFALWIFRIPNIPVPEKYIDTLQFACHTLIYGLFLWYSYPMFAYFRETGQGLYPYSIFFTLLLPALMLRLGWLVMKLLHLTECKLPPLKPKISLISKCIILTAIVLLLCNGFALAGHFIIQAGNLIPSGGSLPVIDRTTIQLYMLTVPKAYHYLIPYITLMKFPVYLFYAIAGCFLGWPVERITE